MQSLKDNPAADDDDDDDDDPSGIMMNGEWQFSEWVN
jgi:hypothetical protein